MVCIIEHCWHPASSFVQESLLQFSTLHYLTYWGRQECYQLHLGTHRAIAWLQSAEIIILRLPTYHLMHTAVGHGGPQHQQCDPQCTHVHVANCNARWYHLSWKQAVFEGAVPGLPCTAVDEATEGFVCPCP